VAPDSIGAEELVEEDVQGIATSAATWSGREVVVDRTTGATGAPGIVRSADFRPAIFLDGLLTVGSTFFSSDSGAFTAADNSRLIVGVGIPNGTYITYVNPTTITLSQAAVIQYADGVITGTTTLTSATAVFAPADNGRTVVGTGIPAGTTMTYVSPTEATLSQAATNAASGVVFQVNGRTAPNTQFAVVGRGRGWQLEVDAAGTGRLQAYVGMVGSFVATGSFVLNMDGSVSIGYGVHGIVSGRFHLGHRGGYGHDLARWETVRRRSGGHGRNFLGGHDRERDDQKPEQRES
jgi:hypothetical protein